MSRWPAYTSRAWASARFRPFPPLTLTIIRPSGLWPFCHSPVWWEAETNIPYNNQQKRENMQDFWLCYPSGSVNKIERKRKEGWALRPCSDLAPASRPTVLKCCWFWPLRALSNKADLRPYGTRFRLGHLRLGELHHWHLCHLCKALDLSFQFKLKSGIRAWTQIWVYVQLSSSGPCCTKWADDQHSRQGSSLGSCLTFLSSKFPL